MLHLGECAIRAPRPPSRSFLFLSLSLGRRAGERLSVARHCGGAQSTATPPSAPLLPRARAGAHHDVVLHWHDTLGLSDTSKAGSFHVGRTLRKRFAWPYTGSRRMLVPSPDSGRGYLLLHPTQHLIQRFNMWYPCLPSPLHRLPK